MKNQELELTVTARITKLIQTLRSLAAMTKISHGNLTEDHSRSSLITIRRYFRKKAREDLLDHIQVATKAVLQNRVFRVN